MNPQKFWARRADERIEPQRTTAYYNKLVYTHNITDPHVVVKSIHVRRALDRVHTDGPMDLLAFELAGERQVSAAVVI